jgi:hypothetical protein
MFLLCFSEFCKGKVFLKWLFYPRIVILCKVWCKLIFGLDYIRKGGYMLNVSPGFSYRG